MNKLRLNNRCFVNILTLTPFLFLFFSPLDIAQPDCNWMSFIFLLSILYSNNVRKTFTSNYVTKNPSSDCDNHRELKQRRRRRQREGQKTNRIRLTKQQLCECITLFCTLLCRHFKPLHDYDVKLPNLTFDCGREHKSNDFLFLFVNFYSPFRSHLLRKSAKFDKVKELE